MATEFNPDMLGIRAYLMADPALDAALRAMAEVAHSYAESNAPVGHAPKDKEAGEYKDSLFIEKHVSTDRMSYRVGSTSKKAWWVEYGTKLMPKFALLRRALDAVTGSAKETSDYAGIEQYDATNQHSAVKRSINRAHRARKKELRGG